MQRLVDPFHRKEGFQEQQASLKGEGRWRRVTMSEAFQPFPAGNMSHMIRLFVDRTRYNHQRSAT
jgi:hypothetical protein